MANGLFDKGREGFLDATIDWDTAVIKAALVRGGSATATALAAWTFMSSVDGTIVATSAALANKTKTNGVADADDVTFSAVPTGAAIERLIIFQSSAVGGGGDVANTAQRVIAYIDTATGLPVTPNNGDITFVFSSGADRIFRL
jgi:hypothetical protein